MRVLCFLSQSTLISRLLTAQATTTSVTNYIKKETLFKFKHFLINQSIIIVVLVSGYEII
jgi:hypothetical protein